MSIKEDYQKAVTLAKQGNYEQARNLLITYDHPKAVSFVERMNSAIAASGSSKNKPSDSNESFTMKLVLSIVLLFILYIPGLIATSIFAKEARQHPNAPGAKAMILLNRILFGLLAGIVIIGFILITIFYFS